MRLTAGLLQLSQGLEERLRTLVTPGRPRGHGRPRARGSARRRSASAASWPWRSRCPTRRGAYVEGFPPDAFQVEAHRRAFELLRAGEADVDRWPDDLADVALAVRLELAGAEVSEAELREAAYRVELPMLRAARRRAAGRGRRAGLAADAGPGAPGARRAARGRLRVSTEVSVMSVEEVRELIEEGRELGARAPLAHRRRRRRRRPLRGAAGAPAPDARGAGHRASTATARPAAQRRRRRASTCRSRPTRTTPCGCTCARSGGCRC